MKTLFLYSSRDGQTKKICQFLIPLVDDEQCQLLPLNETVDLTQFDRIIVGASIRYGHFHKNLHRFIKANSEILNVKQAVFFAVNLTARKEGKDSPETNVYVRKLLAKIQWKPALVGVFAGGLYYPRYKWYDRMIIRFIMWLTGGETDTSKEIEYTNWDKVKSFAEKIKQLS